MKIFHIITGLPKSAGTTTFVENVVREQRALGHEVEIITNGEASSLNSKLQTLNSKLIVFHLHGLWSPLYHRAASFARKHGVPVVWSTHGMTAPWSMRHKWWKKCLPWWLYQKRDLKSAALIHCTTELEEKWNRELGLGKTFVAPLGTTLPERKERRGEGEQRKEKVLLFVGRVYPVKALDNLIRAFAIAINSQPSTLNSQPSTLTLNSKQSPSTPLHFYTAKNLVLRIVGPDQAGHLSELMKLCEELGITYSAPVDLLSTPNFYPAVQFVGPKFGEDLAEEYENCTALALVSHTENFGATVIDAMAHSKPVITSTNTPWSIVMGRTVGNSTVQPSTCNLQPVSEGRCGWWVDNSPESLAKAIVELLSTPSETISLMGRNARELIASAYTWSAVAANLLAQYETVESI